MRSCHLGALLPFFSSLDFFILPKIQDFVGDHLPHDLTEQELGEISDNPLDFIVILDEGPPYVAFLALLTEAERLDPHG